MNQRPFGSPAVLRSFGESFHDLSEEARTRGFPCPSLDGFGFVVYCLLSVVEDSSCRLNSGLYRRYFFFVIRHLLTHYRAHLKVSTKPGLVLIADVFRFDFGSLRLNSAFLQSGRFYTGETPIFRVRFRLRFQPVDATHWLNRSAGVLKFNVSLGRSLSRLATAFSLF